uniref:MAM and LDL-receptor class A domain-containing protein 1-like isoform X1 n=1 Tax=Styela clava TaxID=7725 RepID=UPI00193A33D0|nr:MAM and LDL-receptor class A domain-containing protein 1-like isoform X1 [Styela clava]
MDSRFIIIALLLVKIGSTQELLTIGDEELGIVDDLDVLSQKCESIVTDKTEGVITSPSFPDTYPPISRCNFTIIAPAGHVIEYESTFMNVEEQDPSSALCVYDYVRVYDGDDVSNTYCGQQSIYPNVTTSPILTIWFVSDYTTELEGFKIEWKIVNPEDRDITLNCNFDDGIPLCAGWTNENKEYKWLFTRGHTPSANTGPIADHTTEGSGGRFAFIEASKVDEDSTAILQSPAIISKGIQDKRCLRFWYHMFGEGGMGSLSVYIKDGEGNPTLLASFSGDKGDMWFEGEYTITLESLMSWITFEGKRGSNYKSDMAIDDISITEGDCNQPQRTLEVDNQPPISLTPTLEGGSLIPSDCPTNMEQGSCGDGCVLSCDNLDELGVSIFCARACFGDCACPVELPIFKDGSCVSVQDCTSESNSTVGLTSTTEQTTPGLVESTTNPVEMTAMVKDAKHKKKEEIHDHIVRNVLDAIVIALSESKKN